MTFTEAQSAKIAEDAASRLLASKGFERGVGELDEPHIEPAIQAFAWELGENSATTGWTYEAGLKALVHQALMIAAEQHPTTIGSDERDLEVGVWPAHPDMAADGGPDAIVVQIDTGVGTGRLRVNVNDAAVWDGNPETDQRLGAWFHTEPEAGTENHSAARANISVDDLQTLVDAADKWSTELDDYVIPSATESSAEDAASYTAQMEQIDDALARARALLPTAQITETGSTAAAEEEGKR